MPAANTSGGATPVTKKEGTAAMSESDRLLVLQYFTEQSVITNPREYGYLFDELPKDIPHLVKIVQGLIVHAAWAKQYGLELSAERRQELYLRSIPKMLERLVVLDPTPLSVLRSPEQRLVGICRDFAVVMVSILRHQGIPARLRIGFSGYFRSQRPRYWDHRLTEYWDERLGHWVLIDPQIDEVQRKVLGRQIDTLNITQDSPFLLAGEVWRKCRAGQADPSEFGDSPDDIGMPPIRYALLHDFDALNKVELVGFDAWHDLIGKPESEVTEAEKKLLDEIAELTTDVDARFGGLQTLYQTSIYGQAVRSRLAQLV